MLRRVFCKLLLVAVLALWAFSGVLFAQGHSEEALEYAKAVQERHSNTLMAKPGVVGTAVGLNDEGKHVVMILLEKDGVPGIPQKLEDVPVRPVVTGKIYARIDPTTKFLPPVPIGVSTGNEGECSAGTIGCRVYEDLNVNGTRDDGEPVYAMSNNHVYALENNALIGSLVLQPGRFDTIPQCSIYTDDVVGTLFNYMPIVFHPRANNTIDAAIASTTIFDVDNSTPGGEYTPSATTVEAYVGQPVKKYGRTTGLTTGTVDGINATVRIRYSSGSARFVEQIVIIPGAFSDSGDSGSLIVTDDTACNPVGLLFAGSLSATIANPIDAVLNEFGVTIDGSETPPPPENEPPTVSITSPANGSTFDSGTSISFIGSASDTEDGDLTSSLVWTSDKDGQIGTGGSFSKVLSDGDHIITASVTDSGSKTGSDSISVTVSSSGGGGETMHISAISMWYSTAGPNNFIYTQVTIVDDSGSPVSYATVDLRTTLPNGATASGSGETGTSGSVTFKLKSQQTGTYTSTVTNVTHASLTYDASANVETSDALTVP